MSTTDTGDFSIHHGQAGFSRVCVALVLCGATAFSALYVVQPLLPVFVTDFRITAAQSGLSLSLATLGLLIGLFVVGPVSDAVGRKPVILASTLTTAVLMFALAATQGWMEFLIIRFVMGLMLGGVTSVILTWLAEEIAGDSVARAVGYVLAGNSIGGMVARILAGATVDQFGWRVIMIAIGLFALFSSALLMLWLPRARHFEPARPARGSFLSGYVEHLHQPVLRRAYGQGFLLMFSFVGFFNIIGFHLLQPPYGLSQVAVGMVSIVFLPSSYAAIAAGKLTGRIGAGRASAISIGVVLAGLALCLVPSLPVLCLGTLMFTMGFFGAHSIATSTVGRNVDHNRGQATALYQIFFYTGASLAGIAGGLAWQLDGWTPVVVLLAVAAIVALTLRPKPSVI